MCVGLSMSLYVLAQGSLMPFISWLSRVKMLKQAAKPKAACAAMTLFPKDWASLSETEHGRHRAQSIRQQQCSYQSCTTGNTRKQGTAHLHVQQEQATRTSENTPRGEHLMHTDGFFFFFFLTITPLRTHQINLFYAISWKHIHAVTFKMSTAALELEGGSILRYMLRVIKLDFILAIRFFQQHRSCWCPLPVLCGNNRFFWGVWRSWPSRVYPFCLHLHLKDILWFHRGDQEGASRKSSLQHDQAMSSPVTLKHDTGISLRFYVTLGFHLPLQICVKIKNTYAHEFWSLWLKR